MKKSNRLVRASGTAGLTAFGLSPMGPDTSSLRGDLPLMSCNCHLYEVTRRGSAESLRSFPAAG